MLTSRQAGFASTTVNANRTGSGGAAGAAGTGTPNGSGGSAGPPGITTQIRALPPTPSINFANTIVTGAPPNCELSGALSVQNAGGSFSFPNVGAGDCPGANADPLLDPIGDYGGPTRTYRLHPGSPAIDGGADGVLCPSVDQRGLLRPQGARCDSGAVESGVPPTCQDVGPVHVPFGKKMTFQLVCSDPSGLPVYQYVGVSPFPQHGQVRVAGPAGDGVWSYEPDPGFSGDDSFKYYGRSGNGDAAPKTVTVQVTAPPAAPQVGGTTPASPSNASSPKVTGTAPGGTTVKLFATSDCSGSPLGSGGAADFAGEGIATGPLSEGTIEVRARAFDADDIASPCSTTSVSYTYDATAPLVAINGGPAGITTDPRPVFAFASPEAAVTFACSIDAGVATFGPCSGAGTHQPLAALIVGPYTFRVRATDAAGNSATATRAFTVASATRPVGTAPNTVIVRHPTKTVAAARRARARVRFTFRSRPAGATFACSLDRAKFRPCRSPKSYRVAVGRHRFRVRASSAGRTDPTPASFRFRVVRR